MVTVTKKHLHQMDIKPRPIPRRNTSVSQRKGVSVSKSEDIFPLNEDDLKEF